MTIQITFQKKKLPLPQTPKVELPTPARPTIVTSDQPLTPKGLVDAKGNPIVLDADQYRALELFAAGKNLCVIGKAGTGKTTIVQAMALYYNQHNPSALTQYRIRGANQHTYAPKMAIIAYTNRATNNMHAKLTIHPILGEAFGYNITTGHNLLEYTIEFFINPETGNNTCRYFPQRGPMAPLDIDVLVVEESTMIGVGNKSLWQEIFDALPPHCQIVFLGDINQLPPVIGKPVLSYAIQDSSFTTVELTHVYRQALDNPIIKQAHNCLGGKPIETDMLPCGTKGVTVFKGKAKVKLPWWDFETGVMQVLNHYKKIGLYNPMEDMVLSPYMKLTEDTINASLLSRAIASSLAKEKGSTVYEIRAGFQTVYLAIGDRVFYEKEDGIITKITHNLSYAGKQPKPASKNLDYFGNYHSHHEEDEDDLDFLEESESSPYESVSISKLLEDTEALKEERVRAASHTVEITYPDGTVKSCTSIGEYAELQLGYALSVHKAQGSEWPNVFVVLHDTNATLLFRELLYTGMTRAREFLGIIAQDHVLKKALTTQRIKGNTLEDKIEFFNGGYLTDTVPLDPSTRVEAG